MQLVAEALDQLPESQRLVVWEGRFQPIHAGHLAFIEDLLRRVETLWLVVVKNELSMGRQTPVPEFSKEVDQHHIFSKNVIPHWTTILAVTAAVRSLPQSERVIVLGGRRLDFDWELYDDLLPPGRTFITPIRDSFEDAKAKAWRSLGQTCVRVPMSRHESLAATEVRRRANLGEPLDGIVPEGALDVFARYNISLATSI